MSTRLRSPVGENDYVRGPDDAPVTLVEYGDYECPHCARAFPIIEEVSARLGDQLRFVYRDFPLREAHPRAEPAAEAAAWAGEGGKFWEMHDTLFERRADGPAWLDDDRLLEYASELGLDASGLERALEDERYLAGVRASFIGGVRSGVNGTPTFFINGIRYDGSWEAAPLLRALEEAAASR